MIESKIEWHPLEVIDNDEESGIPIYSFPSEEKPYLVCFHNGDVGIAKFEIYVSRNGMSLMGFDGYVEEEIKAWAELPDGREILKMIGEHK